MDMNSTLSESEWLRRMGFSPLGVQTRENRDGFFHFCGQTILIDSQGGIWEFDGEVIPLGKYERIPDPPLWEPVFPEALDERQKGPLWKRSELHILKPHQAVR
ncbi:MAG: hypothetical protein WC767_00995 [Candidatus Paceibacterota bacterium]|jgi:hypothetical protein